MIHLLLSLPESRTIELLEISPTRDVALHRVTFEEPTLCGWQPTERNVANEVTASQRLELVGAQSAVYLVRTTDLESRGGRWLTYAVTVSESEARAHYQRVASITAMLAATRSTVADNADEIAMQVLGGSPDQEAAASKRQQQAEQTLLAIKPADWAKDLAARLVTRGIAATPEAVTLLPRAAMDDLAGYVGDLELLHVQHDDPSILAANVPAGALQLLRGLVRGVQVTMQDRAGQ